MGTVITKKDNNLLKGGHEVLTPCNCAPESCPVEGRCTLKGVIYQAKLTTQNQESHRYVGHTEKNISVEVPKTL